MAACDNLQGTTNQWQELRDFFEKECPQNIKYMREQPLDKEEYRICYIADIQGWLYENCPLQWVKEQLEDNFIIQTMICGKAHHE